MTRAAALTRWLQRVAFALVAAFLALQLWFFGWVVYWQWHDPAPTAFMRRDLENARSLHGAGISAPGIPAPLRTQQRIWVDYGRISANLKRAVIAAEDGHFLDHGGVDWQAMEKAYRENLRRGHSARGGSTISQQLAKNLFLTPRRSYLRKFQEVLITYMIESVWTKRRILEVYLNVVEWGDGVYGAEAGARHYFASGAAALNLDQAARMAAMLPAPKFFDRHRDSLYLTQRAAVIAKTLPYAQIP